MREKDDLAYYGRRVAEEDGRTSDASNAGAQSAHAKLSAEYRKKVKRLREHESYTIVPEPD